MTDGASIDREQPGHALEQRGLARTVRPDQAEHFPWSDRERHVVQGDELPEGLRQVGDAQSDVGSDLARVSGGSATLWHSLYNYQPS